MREVSYREIIEEEVGQRLDNYLLRVLKGVPKSHIYRIIRGGEVRINKKRAQVSTRLVLGDIIRIPPIRVAEQATTFVSDKLKALLELAIIYEDNSILVISKPAGIAVHGGSGLSLGVIEAFRSLRPKQSYLELVHRLDKETSGCLILAKKRSVLRAIQEQFQARTVKKTYWALLANPWQGNPNQRVNVPLEKFTLKSGERMVAVNPDGKPSETQFKLLENFNSTCLVEVCPQTGRTHQIRVHSAYLQRPVLGDEKYGKVEILKNLSFKPSRLYLHARAIQFILNDKAQIFEAELDTPFKEALDYFRAIPLEIVDSGLYHSKEKR